MTSKLAYTTPWYSMAFMNTNITYAFSTKRPSFERINTQMLHI
jgi:hypothetical protein